MRISPKTSNMENDRLHPQKADTHTHKGKKDKRRTNEKKNDDLMGIPENL